MVLNCFVLCLCDRILIFDPFLDNNLILANELFSFLLRAKPSLNINCIMPPNIHHSPSLKGLFLRGVILNKWGRGKN